MACPLTLKPPGVARLLTGRSTVRSRAPTIFSERNDLQMPGVHTKAIEAEMVYGEAGGNGTMLGLPVQAVRIGHAFG